MTQSSATAQKVHKVTLIPGDGIGPEISRAMQDVIDASGAKIDWEIVNAGEGVMEEKGTPLPAEVIESIKKNKCAIKGPITTPVGSGFRSVNVALRKELDLFVNLRPAFSLPGNGSRYEDIDLVVVRENTEDLYAGIEFEHGSQEFADLRDFVHDSLGADIAADAGVSLKPISIEGSRRIVDWAYEYALKHKRKKVTAVHKANILKYSDGLFLKVARQQAERFEQEHPGALEFEDKIVDATCMGLVLNPQDFDVMVLPNLYGDIVSDLVAGLIGGLGIAPGANIGSEYAVFEAVHGSAPLMAGQNRANPTALILSAVMMLRHLGEEKAADRVLDAIRTVLAEGKKVTGDVMRTLTGSREGAVGTDEYARALIEAMC